MTTSAQLWMAGMIMAIGCFPSYAAERECSVPFTEKQFLRAAAERGMAPKRTSGCITVSVADNAFYATSQSPCYLSFNNREWLTRKSRFLRLVGHGSFTQQGSAGGIRVEIEPEGAMRISRVWIATKGEFDSCDEVSVGDVLLDY